LSLLLGQICSVGARLNSQLIAIGGALASQIAEKAKGGDPEGAPAAAEQAPGAEQTPVAEQAPAADQPPAAPAEGGTPA
jgi:hypothetical protein